MQPGWHKRALIVAGIALPIALLVAVGLPFCPTATLFGIPCPGCGLTRATLALFRGDVGRALAFHPLVFVLLPVYVGAVSVALSTYVRGVPARDAPTPARGASFVTSRGFTIVAALLLLLVLGVWVARFFGAFGGPVPVETLRR